MDSLQEERTIIPLFKDWLALGKSSLQNKRLENYLFNQRTSLPTSPLLLPLIGKMQEEGQIGLIYIEIAGCEEELSDSWEVYDETVELTAKQILEVKNKYLRENDLLAELVKGSNAFIIVVSSSRTSKEITNRNLSLIATRIKSYLEQLWKKDTALVDYSRLTLSAGFSPIKQFANVPSETLLADALDEAILSCKQSHSLEREKRRISIQSFLKQEGLTTVLSPIFDLKQVDSFGQRIMCFGPGGQILTPCKLFSSIKKEPFYPKVYSFYLQHILKATEETSSKLFVYIDTCILNISEFYKLVETALSAGKSFLPLQIIFEIDSKSALNNPVICFPAARYLRNLGFDLAFININSPFEALEIADSIEPNYLIINPFSIKHTEKYNTDINTLQLFDDMATRKSTQVIFEVSQGSNLEILHKLGIGLVHIIPDSQSHKSRISGFLTSFISPAS